MLQGCHNSFTVATDCCALCLSMQLILRAINSAHSAFLAVSLSSQFFESYNVFSQKGVVQAGVLIKVCTEGVLQQMPLRDR